MIERGALAPLSFCIGTDEEALMSRLSTPRKSQLLWTSSALILVALVLWPALSGGFIFDDYPILVDNPALHVAQWNWHAWRGVWLWSMADIHRPLAMLSYALNCAAGSTAWGFKATNLAIHLLNTLLVAALAKRLFRAGWPMRDGDDAVEHERRANLWGLALATLWAVHPLQVSAVMYVVQRMELLGFTFTLLALLSYWHARQHQIHGRRGWPWLLGTLSLIVIGYGFKETIALVPGYALLIELAVLRFAAATPATRRRWQFFYALGVLTGVALFAFYLVPHYANTFGGRQYTAWERELTQLRALAMYIGWCVLPLPGQLHFYYDNYTISTGWLTPASTLTSGLFLLALAGLAIAMRKRRPLFALGIGWFFMAHVITSSPIPLELVFEHRNYPALFGILLALTDLAWLATGKAHPRLPALLATVFLASLSFITVLRAATWGNPAQLAITLAHDNPASPRASHDLARLYLDAAKAHPQSPYLHLAMQEFERGAALPGSSPLPEEALILIAARQNMPIQQAWWNSFLHKLKTRPLGPQEFTALNDLATRRVNGNLPSIDAHQLQRAFEIVIERQPHNITWRTQYADLASFVLHDPTLAIQQWRQALQLSHDVPAYSRSLAGYLLNTQRPQEALAVIAEAQALSPPLHDDAILLALKSRAERALDKPPTRPGQK